MQFNAQKFKAEGKHNKFVESFEKLDYLSGPSRSITIFKSAEETDKLIKNNEKVNNYVQNEIYPKSSNEEFTTKNKEIS